jgi:hypothetical protein
MGSITTTEFAGEPPPTVAHRSRSSQNGEADCWELVLPHTAEVEDDSMDWFSMP